MSNVFFFTGENTFALHKELSRWKKGFREKHGNENLAEFEGAKLSLSELLDAVSSMPFIAEKRLVLLHGIPKIDKDEWKRIEEAMHSQTILAFVDAKPDKRLTLVKILQNAAELKKFPLLSRAQAICWITHTTKSFGASIAPDAIAALLEIAGEDLWVLEGEITKLALFAGDREISVGDIELLTVPSGEQVIWKLTDLLGQGKAEEAIRFVSWKTERGEDAYALWTILLNMIKNLTVIWASVDAGVRDERSIAVAAGVHFLAVRNLLPLAKKLQKDAMKDLVMWTASADIELKTGGYKYTAERQQEVVALTEQLILKCR